MPRRFQKVDRAWNTFIRFVNAHIQSISEDISEQRDIGLNSIGDAEDVLHRLIASSQTDGKYRLSGQEVVRIHRTERQGGD